MLCSLINGEKLKMWRVTGDEGGGGAQNSAVISTFNFTHMRKISLLNLMAQEAYLTSAILERFFFLR